VHVGPMCVCRSVCMYVCKSCPITGLNRPIRFQEVKAPRFLDNWHMKVVGCQPYAPAAFTPGLTWYPFLEAESTPGHMELSAATEKKPGDTGNRCRDFPTCSAVHLCMYACVHVHVYMYIYMCVCAQVCLLGCVSVLPRFMFRN